MCCNERRRGRILNDHRLDTVLKRSLECQQAMNLTDYKEQLRLEILAIVKSNGVRKTCRDAGISLSVWHRIKKNESMPIEAIEKNLKKVKNCLNVSK